MTDTKKVVCIKILGVCLTLCSREEQKEKQEEQLTNFSHEFLTVLEKNQKCPALQEAQKECFTGCSQQRTKIWGQFKQSCYTQKHTLTTKSHKDLDSHLSFQAGLFFSCQTPYKKLNHLSNLNKIQAVLQNQSFPWRCGLQGGVLLSCSIHITRNPSRSILTEK